MITKLGVVIRYVRDAYAEQKSRAIATVVHTARIVVTQTPLLSSHPALISQGFDKQHLIPNRLIENHSNLFPIDRSLNRGMNGHSLLANAKELGIVDCIIGASVVMSIFQVASGLRRGKIGDVVRGVVGLKLVVSPIGLLGIPVYIAVDKLMKKLEENGGLPMVKENDLGVQHDRPRSTNTTGGT